MATTASTNASPVHAESGAPGEVVGVGIDIGSTNTKVALVACGSEVRELAVREFATPDAAQELVGMSLQAVRELTAVAPRHPLVVGIASMAETGVPLDEAGHALTPLIRWNAAVDAHAGTDVFDTLDRQRFFRDTGVPPLPKAPIAMWHRLRQQDPELWQRLSRWCGVSALLTHALTGTYATDHTLAGRTGAYLLPHEGERMPRGFDARLLAVAGLAPHQLPRVIAPGDAAGRVTAAAASASGLRTGTPVYVAGHDHAVGAWGAGARGPGDVADSMGTTEALIRVLGTAADRGAVYSTGMSLTRTATARHESLLAGANGGSLLGHPGDSAVGTLTAATASLGELIVLPFPSGRQTPHPDRHARLRVIDTTGRDVDPGTRSSHEIRRATLLGLCLQLRWMAGTQRGIAGVDGDGSTAALPPELAVIGGAPAGDTEWLALKSLVLGTTLRVASISQPVACSAALLAAVRAGHCTDDVRLPAASVSPKPSHDTRDVDAAYATFRRAALERSTHSPAEERRA